MRKTSFGLGLAGTIIALVIALIMLAVAITVTVVSNFDFDKMGTHMDENELYFDKDDKELEFDEDSEELYFDKDGKGMHSRMRNSMGKMGMRFNGRFDGDFGGMQRMMLNMLTGWLWFATAAMLIAGALGIVGTVITRRKKSTAAGVLLLVAAVLSIFSLYGLYASSLLIPSGVLAFIKDKSEKEEDKA